MIPKVKINFSNGAIGSVKPAEDGSSALLAVGTAEEEVVKVDDKDKTISILELGTVYTVTQLSDFVSKFPLKQEKNKKLCEAVADFYKYAPNGTLLSFMVVSDSDKSTLYASENGALEKLMDNVSHDVHFVIDATGPKDENPDLLLQLTDINKQVEDLGEKYSTPFFVIVDSTAKSVDLTKSNFNRVACLYMSQGKDKKSCTSLFGGRLASIPVHRCVARTKDGAFSYDEMYIGNNIATNSEATLANDKGYITVRTFPGKAGYYITDDLMATATKDDYGVIARRRVADKAYRVAYNTMVDFIGDEIALTADGEIAAHEIKKIQNALERALETQMTNLGNLSVDPSDENDKGMQVIIDEKQNILSTSALNVSLRIRPYGYAKYINVDLGFQTNK
ncbi:DUF2586 domain-containing protein [Gammaproteobacteria bacterium]|nr:DUF2586 domain-containing protein [Gammaproteobacteria bacterium]